MAVYAQPGLRLIALDVAGLATVQTSLEKLLAQEHENKLVLQELKSTPPEFGVYKQTGPVLLAQDHKEAHDNVAKRLVFIRSEKKRAQDRIKTLQEQVTRVSSASRGLCTLRSTHLARIVEAESAVVAGQMSVCFSSL